MPNLYIEQLLDTQVTQKLQDSFTEYTGLAAVITDSAGRQITATTGFSDVCLNHIRTSAELTKKCMDCCVKGAFESVKLDAPYMYKCHGGMRCFAAPIMLEDTVIGAFCGGQVICTDEDEQQLFVCFSELGFSPEECVKMTQGVKRITINEFRKAAAFLYKLTGILSSTAYKNFILTKKSELQEGETAPDIADYLRALKDPSYERVYQTRELFGSVKSTAEAMCSAAYVPFSMAISDDVPRMLLGNPKHIQSGIEAVIGFILSIPGSEGIRLEVTAANTNYSCSLILDIIAEGTHTPEELLYEINSRIYSSSMAPAPSDDSAGNILTNVFIKKLSGNIKIINIDGKGTAARITIPQLPDKEI